MLSPQIVAFIFEYIDSVEQLEILLLLSADPEKSWTAETLSRDLRSNPNSVQQRLKSLWARNLVESKEGAYRFNAADSALAKTVADVAGAYKTHRHRVLELIFSPLKKARHFAEAFRLGSDKKEGDGNG